MKFHPSTSTSSSDAVPEAECAWDGTVLQASGDFLRLFGIDAPPPDWNFHSLVDDSSREAADHLWHAVQAGRAGRPVPVTLNGVTGEHILQLERRAQGHGGQRRLLVRLRLHDERLALSHALESTERRFRLLFEHTSDLVLWLSPDLDVLGGNPAFETFTGLEFESFYQGLRSWRDFILVEDQDKVGAACAQALADPGGTVQTSARVVSRAGPRWHSFSLHPVVEEGSVRGLFCLARDTQSLKDAESDLNRQAQTFQDRQSETLRRLDRMKALVGNLAGLTGGRAEFLAAVRDSLSRLFPGLAVLVDTHPEPLPVFSGNDGGLLNAPLIELLYECRVPVVWGRPEEAPIPLDDVIACFLGVGVFGGAGEPVGALCVAGTEPHRFSPEDVDTLLHASLLLSSHLAQWRQEEERERRERRQSQDQKMEALGRLAGGLAHDFNNLIGIILNYAQYARNALSEGAPGAKDLEVVAQTAEQAADLTRKLMLFARAKPSERVPLDLNALVREIVEVTRHGLRKDLKLELDLQEALPPVLGDSTRLKQVAMNLLLNAAQAIGEQAGRVVIATRLAEPPRGVREQLRPSRRGEAVLLEVIDNGPGIPASLRPHVFEGFQTTRRDGVGLGLSIVHSVATQHGGTVEVSSEPGLGATFRVWLPSASGN